MYPKADIPCIQISLMNNLNSSKNIKIGEILFDLPKSNIVLYYKTHF